MKEIWRPISEGFMASSLGRIKNTRFHRGNAERIMKLDGSAKYLRIEIKQKAYLVHNLVAQAFPEICGEWFDGCDVHHINGDKYDNRAENLIVLTKEQHQEIHKQTLLKPVQRFSLEGELLDTYESISEAGQKTGICRPNINKCLKGKRKTAGGYIWKYKERETD